MKIAVLGAGSWGTALGQVLSENGHDVLLWHLEQDFVDEINQTHKHPFLPNIQLSKDLHFTASLDEIAEYEEIGKFAHILDSEGNKIELWEPPKSNIEDKK